MCWARGERVPTQIFNGYGDYVAGLYPDLNDHNYFYWGAQPAAGRSSPPTPHAHRRAAFADHQLGLEHDVARRLLRGAVVDAADQHAEGFVDHVVDRMFGAGEARSQAADARDRVGRGDGNVLRTFEARDRQWRASGRAPSTPLAT